LSVFDEDIMIVEYHRPIKLEEALELLKRVEPRTVPLAGGTAVKQREQGAFAVVDLQALGLNSIRRRGSTLEMGATATLQALLDQPDLPEALKDVILHEASHNLRQSATVAGTLIAADGRSPFATALLALDAQLSLQPGDRTLSLGELYTLRGEHLKQSLVVQVKVNTQVDLAYEYTARSPKDLPLVCAAAGRWPSGRTRLALGGYGNFPLLVMDGPEPGGALEAARNAYADAEDEWASAEYRSEIAGVLAERVTAGKTAEQAHE
jgi:CO/xanthine dehydrogenase FAD-binding subunit